MSSDRVIEFHNVTKIFGHYEAMHNIRAFIKRLKAGKLTGSVSLGNRQVVLEAVNFKVNRGERVGIIGPNGAGKSTILSLINSVLEPTCGSIHVAGSVGGIFEVNAGFQGNLTAEENVLINLTYQGYSRREARAMLDEVFDNAELQNHRHAPFRNLSSGMKVRLGFFSALRSNPDIVLLDEVFAVGDLRLRKKSTEMIESYAKGKTLLFVSHSMNDIAGLCDRVLVLSGGRILFDGDVDKGINLYERICSERSQSKHELILNNPHGVYIEPTVSVKAHRFSVDGQFCNAFRKGVLVECITEIENSGVGANAQICIDLKKVADVSFTSLLGRYQFPVEQAAAEVLHWQFSTRALYPGQYFLEIRTISSTDQRHTATRLWRYDFEVTSAIAASGAGVADFEVSLSNPVAI